jgi:hypothetical protein
MLLQKLLTTFIRNSATSEPEDEDVLEDEEDFLIDIGEILQSCAGVCREGIHHFRRI